MYGMKTGNWRSSPPSTSAKRDGRRHIRLKLGHLTWLGPGKIPFPAEDRWATHLYGRATPAQIGFFRVTSVLIGLLFGHQCGKPGVSPELLTPPKRPFLSRELERGSIWPANKDNTYDSGMDHISRQH